MEKMSNGMDQSESPRNHVSKGIPVRRVVLKDPSELPSRYSETPGGTMFSTTPGGKFLAYVIYSVNNIAFLCFNKICA